MNLADLIVLVGGIGAGLGLVYIVWTYVKGLHESPRDMWFMFVTKIIEYTAYAAMNMTFILWLTADCGLGDIQAGTFISAWSIGLSAVAMVAGALVDALGLKKTLLASSVMLLFSRFFMSFVTDPTLVMILGFIPLALGFAIVGPVISVAIKKFTTKEGAALGFGLFYVLMNLAYAIGGGLFDFVRDHLAQKDAMGKVLNENFGMDIPMLGHFSTYQVFFIIGFIFTIISTLFIFLLREGVEVTEEGIKITPPEKEEGNFLQVFMKTGSRAAKETWQTISTTMREKFFWQFIGLLSLTLFVRFVFFHFHYTFPKYGIRVLGEGAKIGNIYGVLNPVLVIYLVPIIAYFTKKVSSYKMLIVGSTISAFSVFIATIPGSAFAWLTNTVLGELIFIKWLGLAPDMAALAANPPTTAYWPLIFFILVFTVGEAIWSPRLMQFTAEIAPKGKEGTYIALSVLPYFFAKFFVGPMSGILVKAYTPLTEKLDSAGNVVMEAGKAVMVIGDISNHHMVWVWIGGMAILTPIGLLFFKKLFDKHE